MNIVNNQNIFSFSRDSHIVIPVNKVNVMGKGLALQFKYKMLN